MGKPLSNQLLIQDFLIVTRTELNFGIKTHQCFLGTHQILAHRRVNDLATFFVGLSASLLVTVPIIDLARQVLTSWQIKTITLKNICHHAELLLASFRKVVLACSEGAAETTSLETWQIRVIP